MPLYKVLVTARTVRYVEATNEKQAKTFACEGKGFVNAQESTYEAGIPEVIPEPSLVDCVTAEVHDDGGRVSVTFDATPWFMTASDENILALAHEQWGAGYVSDTVADTSEEPRIHEIWNYINIVNTVGRETIGFVCQVDPDSALTWLQHHKPALYDQITQGE